jgi:hypothetical protein
MAAEIKKEIQLEIAHVLFIDIVGYSKLSINEQGAVVDELTAVVRSSDRSALPKTRCVSRAEIGWPSLWRSALQSVLGFVAR